MEVQNLTFTGYLDFTLIPGSLKTATQVAKVAIETHSFLQHPTPQTNKIDINTRNRYKKTVKEATGKLKMPDKMYLRFPFEPKFTGVQKILDKFSNEVYKFEFMKDVCNIFILQKLLRSFKISLSSLKLSVNVSHISRFRNCA